MNKALIPAFFLLGSLILGVSVMLPQFANAQGEQKVNDQQMQALKLFFNAQNPADSNSNPQTETSSDSQSFPVQTQQWSGAIVSRTNRWQVSANRQRPPENAAFL